ncbi:hypothetical protein N0V90_009490 [Kalmusia sp. IMI 367209]|nr:hypothetical protein N0V90_009490 [Kalmusia sp. IMI 367209]
MAAKIEYHSLKPVTRNFDRMVPGITRKKLPWLDGKSSIASSPMVSPPGHASTPKRDPSVSPSSRQGTLESLTIESKPLTSSAGPGGVVTRVKGSKIRHPSEARSAPTSTDPFTSHEPRKRLSIVHVEEPEDMFVDARLRADGLAPVPDYLERIETPDSILRLVERNVYASPPRIVKSVQRSPSQPVPRPSVFERASQRRLSNAIEGLEELVDDAVITAEYTERPEHVEEIYAIIEDASFAVRDASTEPARHLMKSSSPLQVFSEEVSHLSSEITA